MHMKKSLYDILGVSPDAGPGQIETAFRLASQDLAAAANHDQNATVILREAYHVLSNPHRRAAYDASLISRAAPVSMRQDDDDNTHEQIARIKLWSRWIFGALVVGVAIFVLTSKKHVPEKPVAVKVLTPPTVLSRIEPANTTTPTPQANAGPKSAQQIYEERSPNIALIKVANQSNTPVSQGSGVVIDNGVVITNCHVVRNGTQINVKVGNNDASARVDVADEELDLCRLSVAGLAAPVTPMGAGDTLKVGQKVFAIGAPQGLDLTISEGIISSLRTTPYGNVIQTTAAVSPGSSGGGLFDESGKLVGIVTFQVRSGQNLNFAVPSDWIGQMRSRSGTGETF